MDRSLSKGQKGGGATVPIVPTVPKAVISRAYGRDDPGTVGTQTHIQGRKRPQSPFGVSVRNHKARDVRDVRDARIPASYCMEGHASHEPTKPTEALLSGDKTPEDA